MNEDKMGEVIVLIGSLILVVDILMGVLK